MSHRNIKWMITGISPQNVVWLNILNIKKKSSFSHLRGSAHLERPKDDVDHPLRCEYISSDHCCILGRLKDWARWYYYLDWCKTALDGKKGGSQEQFSPNLDNI